MNAPPQLASNDNRRCHQMYAIIATGGKQYKVAEGDVIKVEKLGVAAVSIFPISMVRCSTLPILIPLAISSPWC